jgi:hypothetical protein
MPGAPMPPIVPMPAPLEEEALPEVHARAPKKGAPVALVAGGLAGVLVVAAVLVAVLWKSAPPITARPKLDGQGKEMLHLQCEGCVDGTTATLEKQKAVFASHEADLLLAAPLKVGQNPIELRIDRPGAGRDEAVKLTIPVDFRIRADLTDIAANPPVVQIRVETLPGAEVKVNDHPVSLDATGHGAWPIDVSAETTGPSDEVKIIDKKIAYTVKQKDAAQPENGQLAVRVGVMPLHLDAPGLQAVTDGANFWVAGQSSVGAQLKVNGKSVQPEQNGVFATQVDAPAAGEVPVEVQTVLANYAPRTARFTVKRTGDLEAEAQARESAGGLLGYDTLAADVAGKTGQPAAVEGEIVEARVAGHQTIFLVDDKRGCAHGPCMIRVVHGAEDKLARGDALRAYGRVTRSVAAAGGKSVPEVEADFVLKGKTRKKR